jgi:hypothetical protein
MPKQHLTGSFHYRHQSLPPGHALEVGNFYIAEQRVEDRVGEGGLVRIVAVDRVGSDAQAIGEGGSSTQERRAEAGA